MDQTSSHQSSIHPKPLEPAVAGHNLSPDDPDNPQNWPIIKKIYVSFVSWHFAFVVAFGLTSYTAGLMPVIMHYKVSRTVGILGYSIFLFGVFFAPIHTPHLSERFGRRPVYYVGFFLFCMFELGAGLSPTFAGVAICRFLAGLFGGPMLVLIEGTFADVWSINVTGTYYAFLTTGSYFGAALGPIITNFIVPQESFHWTHYLTLMLAALVFLFALPPIFPETYPREIARSRARKAGMPHHLPPAESGTTLGAMARNTLFNPVLQLVTEPPVLLISFSLLLNFAVLFSWFIVVPPVLTMTHSFTPQQDGLAFISAIIGVSLAAFFVTVFDQIAHPTFVRAASSSQSHSSQTMMAKVIVMAADIEYRLFPAMFGVFLIPASLFWIGWTAKPDVHFLVPIFGTAVYVWGSAMVLISYVSWLFDAYSPRGTLSALTAAACFRIAGAGVLPLVILQDITSSLGGDWGLAIFGFIGIAIVPVPFVLFAFGKQWRKNSRYASGMMIGGKEKGVADAEMDGMVMGQPQMGAA